MRKTQVKREISLAKLREGRSKATEPTDVVVKSTIEMLPKSLSNASASSEGMYTQAASPGLQQNTGIYVPVVDSDQKPLMPTTPARARKWIKSGKATPFWKRGIFCVRLNEEPSARETQVIAVGIDPGSKKEAYTVKSDSHTYLNIQADTPHWVKKHVETKRNMRKLRRYRNTPCRQPRFNRVVGGIPPSTKARWQWKLRLCNWLSKMFPIDAFVVEDIKAKTKGKKRWDTSFSPLEVGKQWFYEELEKLAQVKTRLGYQTKELRDDLGLKKTKDKLANVFSAHCVDSWVLANWWTGGHLNPDNTRMLAISPLQSHRRELHRLKPEIGGNRKPYGGTMSMGFKRGSLVKHTKLGITYVGGAPSGRVSLHSLETGKRVTTNSKTSDIKFLSFNSWRIYPV